MSWSGKTCGLEVPILGEMHTVLRVEKENGERYWRKKKEKENDAEGTISRKREKERTYGANRKEIQENYVRMKEIHENYVRTKALENSSRLDDELGELMKQEMNARAKEQLQSRNLPVDKLPQA